MGKPLIQSASEKRLPPVRALHPQHFSLNRPAEIVIQDVTPAVVCGVCVCGCGECVERACTDFAACGHFGCFCVTLAEISVKKASDRKVHTTRIGKRVWIGVFEFHHSDTHSQQLRYRHLTHMPIRVRPLVGESFSRTMLTLRTYRHGFKASIFNSSSVRTTLVPHITLQHIFIANIYSTAHHTTPRISNSSSLELKIPLLFR